MSTDEVPTLVTKRKYSDADPWIVPGSVESVCHLCDTPVWIAKAGQALLAEHPSTQVWCIECTLSRVRETDNFEIAPGALEEATDHYRTMKEHHGT